MTVAQQFIDEQIYESKVLEKGHINETILLTGRDKYILQGINRELYGEHTDTLSANYECYVNAARSLKDELPDWQVPDWLKSKEGSFFYTDHEGKIWRAYKFIEATTSPKMDREKHIYECGAGLAKFHYIMHKCSAGSVKAVIPDLNDCGHYYELYKQQGQKLSAGIRARIPEADNAIEKYIKEFSSLAFPADHVILCI